MKVITLAKTKELLGITDTASDVAITAKIPYIDSLVKQITKNRFNYTIYGSTTLDSKYVTIESIISYNGDQYIYSRKDRRFYSSGINNNDYFEDIAEYLNIGDQVEGDNIPTGNYIDELYYNGLSLTSGDIDTPTIKLAEAATATDGGSLIYIGMNISYQPIIAKGIQYLINCTSSVLPGRAVTGVGSVSYSDADSKINNKYGMPDWFVKAFPKFMVGH